MTSAVNSLSNKKLFAYVPNNIMLNHPDANYCKTMSILHTVTQSALAGLIANRVFIDLIVIDVTNDYLSINAESVEYANSPENESSGVCGTNHPSTIVCNRVPDDKNKTRLTTYIQTDLGGMLPQSLVDQALPASQMQFFAGLKKALKDAGH